MISSLSQPIVSSTRDVTSERQLPLAIFPIVAVLRQLAEVIRALTDDQYRQKPVGVVASSIGGHVRHCLDHVEALVTGVDKGELDYDDRRRGTDVETNREAALNFLRLEEQRLLAFPAHCESYPLRLSAVVNSSLPATMVQTTVGRELSFVLSHTIHHNALIAVMALLLGVPIPDRFGLAPSTIAHLENSPCAR